MDKQRNSTLFIKSLLVFSSVILNVKWYLNQYGLFVYLLQDWKPDLVLYYTRSFGLILNFSCSVLLFCSALAIGIRKNKTDFKFMFKSHYTYNQQITAVSKDKWYLNIYLSLLTLKNAILVLHCNYNILLRRLN